MSTAERPITAPPAPEAPLGVRRKLAALTVFHTGPGDVARAAGPVALLTFRPRWLIPPYAMVTSPQGARDVLGRADGAFDKQHIMHRQSQAFGRNVFNLPHDPWVGRRRLLQPLFTRRHVATFAGHMAESADTLTAEWIDRGVVDLDEQTRRLTLRVIGRSVFGLDLGERAEQLGPHVHVLLGWLTARAQRPVRAPGRLPTPARHRMRRALAAVRSVIDEAITAARADPDGDAELIQLLLQSADPDTGRPLTDEQIRDELLVFLIAGHDTTSTTLAYSLWALGRDPGLQDRLAGEVAALGGRRPSVDDLPALALTTRVIHESLRICPPAPVIVRSAVQDAVVGGYLIPAGTQVMVGVYAMHHDPALWADPDRFDPDRFATLRLAGDDRWRYLPFGGGPRSCIGDHFAMLEAALGLATIIGTARIDALDDEFPIALPFTLTAGGPVRARISRR
ncbi:cytochrome P450 [Nakamurella sp.]|uniref:cytochrome P450 n=1 Tax=Nakamurella sp. TaxID=1869182 RepID=UPI003784FF65